MKKIVTYLFVIMAVSFNAFSQSYCSTNEFGPYENYSTNQIIKSTIKYLSKTINNNDTLISIDIYKPNSTLLSKRPLVMLIHGGGFSEGDRTKLTNESIRFARSGYIAATIDYRLTNHGCNSNELYRQAVYKATQDGHRALLKLLSKKNVIKFDPKQIFLLGVSAGSAIAMNMIYFEQDEANLLEPNLEELYGSLRPINDDYNLIKIKGVYTGAAGMLDDIFDDIEAVPQILFHGTNDSIVPVYSGLPKCSTDSVWGSKKIFETLSNKVCVNTYIEPDGGHASFDSERKYRDGKAMSFFKSLLCNTCQVNEPFICQTSSLINIVCVPDDNQNRILNYESNKNSVNLQNENVLRFKFDVDITNEIDFSMYDIMGKLVFEKKVYVEKGLNYIDFEIDKSISSGVYIVKWNDKKGNYYSNKIIKN